MKSNCRFVKSILQKERYIVSVFLSIRFIATFFYVVLYSAIIIFACWLVREIVQVFVIARWQSSYQVFIWTLLLFSCSYIVIFVTYLYFENIWCQSSYQVLHCSRGLNSQNFPGDRFSRTKTFRTKRVNCFMQMRQKSGQIVFVTYTLIHVCNNDVQKVVNIFPDGLESCQTIRKASRPSGKLSDH